MICQQVLPPIQYYRLQPTFPNFKISHKFITIQYIMRNSNILFERNNCECSCDIFPSAKLTLSISKDQPSEQSQRVMHSERLKQKYERSDKTKEKLSVSHLKKEREVSRGVNMRYGRQNPEERSKIRREQEGGMGKGRYNLQYDSYHAYRRDDAAPFIKEVTHAAIYLNSEQKGRQMPAFTSRPINCFDTKKYLRDDRLVLIPHLGLGKPQITYQNKIQVLPLPPHFQSTIRGVQTSSSIRRLHTDVSQSHTSKPQFREPYLSTQASNYQFITKTEKSIHSNHKDPSLSNSNSNKNSNSVLSNPNQDLRFRPIESVHCSEESDRQSEVLSFQGFQKREGENCIGKRSTGIIEKEKGSNQKYQSSASKKCRSNWLAGL